MAKVISELVISYLFWTITGYDFFIILTICSYSIELYKRICNTLKIIKKYTKDNLVKKTVS